VLSWQAEVLPVVAGVGVAVMDFPIILNSLCDPASAREILLKKYITDADFFHGWYVSKVSSPHGFWQCELHCIFACTEGAEAVWRLGCLLGCKPAGVVEQSPLFETVGLP
jgi:hypothetical protein